MTPESLDAALAAAAGEASSLRMVAFSHLDLAGWREKQECILPQGSINNSGVDYALKLTAQPLVQAPAAGMLQVRSPESAAEERADCAHGSSALSAASIWFHHGSLSGEAPRSPGRQEGDP